MCFVIATEYIGTFRWGKNGIVDNVFTQNSSYMETVKKDYWGRENQNAYLEYDTSNENYAFVGGTIMSNKMWTSTQSTQFTYSWYYDINIQGDHLDTSTRSNPRYVRPFTELIL